MGVIAAFEVVQLEGMRRRNVTRATKTGLETRVEEQPEGYMVYFPAGHSIRVSEKELLRLGFAKPRLYDENSGELVPDEDEQPISLKQRSEAKTKHTPGRRASAPQE